jgi:hypothetical protein
MPSVSLRAFLTSGSLGPVGIGAERALVETTFGPPDDFDAASENHQAAKIWRYGDVELHFEHDRVRLIHVDRFSGQGNAPAAGAALDLDPWVIVEGLSLDAFTEALERAGVQHTVLVQPELDRTLLTLPSGVDVGFSSPSRHEARLEFVSRTR